MGLDTLIIRKIKKGFTPSQISKRLKIPKQTISYHVGKLKKEGFIKNVSYGVWEVLKDVQPLPKGGVIGDIGTSFLPVRGHAFMWVISFFDFKTDVWELWERRVKSYVLHHHSNRDLKFSLIGPGKGFFRVVFNGRILWLTSKGMIIYESEYNDFFGRSSYDSLGKAVYSMDRLIKDFLKKINQPFSFYKFTTNKKHFALVNNGFAKYFNDKKEKLYVKRDEDSNYFLWVDHSKGDHELESPEASTHRRWQNWAKDQEKHKCEVNSTFVLEGFKNTNSMINNIMSNQVVYNENIVSHVDSIKKLGFAVTELTNIVKELKGGINKNE